MPDPSLVFAYLCARLGIDPRDERGMTTTEVASRLGVTPGAVSQQLAMLRRAGVVDAHRSGRGVYSELTPLGTSLLALLDA